MEINKKAIHHILLWLIIGIWRQDICVFFAFLFVRIKLSLQILCYDQLNIIIFFVLFQWWPCYETIYTSPWWNIEIGLKVCVGRSWWMSSVCAAWSLWQFKGKTNGQVDWKSMQILMGNVQVFIMKNNFAFYGSSWDVKSLR